MKKYLSYFVLRFNTVLQYRLSAVAGMFNQLFWGTMQILIYMAFYKSTYSNNISLEQLISYVWLRQTFYSIVNNTTDPEIRTTIETGNISYELTKPLNLYWMWFSKTISTRLATAFFKCFPILFITLFLLPEKFSLKPPISFYAFILFLISLFIGLLIIATLINLFYISIFYTTTSKGTTSFYYAFFEFFGGGFIPIALMPKFWQKICYILPIGIAADLPFRIYTGNISVYAGLHFIFIQVLWLFTLIILGNFVLNRLLKKVVIQGG